VSACRINCASAQVNVSCECADGGRRRSLARQAAAIAKASATSAPLATAASALLGKGGMRYLRGAVRRASRRSVSRWCGNRFELEITAAGSLYPWLRQVTFLRPSAARCDADCHFWRICGALSCRASPINEWKRFHPPIGMHVAVTISNQPPISTCIHKTAKTAFL